MPFFDPWLYTEFTWTWKSLLVLQVKALLTGKKTNISDTFCMFKSKNCHTVRDHDLQSKQETAIQL